MHAFIALVNAGLPQKFPKLRFGLIEAGASWIPYTISQLGAQKRAALRGQQSQSPDLYDLEPELFESNRLFVAIDPIDDIRTLLKFGTEDHLMIGTDYSHTDISANLSALDEVNGWANEGRITQDQAKKILHTNAKAFYGL